MRRKYPHQPVVSVGAVIIHEGNILLVKRGVEPGRDMWSIPGGAVELGERVEDALIREVMEECGLEVEVDGILDVVDNIILNSQKKIKFHYVILNFLVQLKGGTLKPADDVADARWVSLGEAENYDLTLSFRSFFRKHKDELEKLEVKAY